MVNPPVQISKRKVICDDAEDVEVRNREEDSGSSDEEEAEEQITVKDNNERDMHDAVHVPLFLSDSDGKGDDPEEEEEETVAEEEGGGPVLDETWMDSEGYEIGPTGNMRRKPKRQRLLTGRVVLPDNIRSLLGDAHSAYVANDLPKAIYLLGECIRQAPHVPNAYRTLALIYEEKEQNHERALGLYTIVANLEPKNLEVQQKTARLALELGNLEVALDCLKRATILNPNNISMALEKAWLFSETRKARRAVDDVKKLLRTNQHNIDLYFFLGDVAEKNHAFHSTALQAYALCLRYVLGQQVYVKQGIKDICDSADWIDPLPERDTLDIPNTEVAFSAGVCLSTILINDRKYNLVKDAIASIVQWLQAARLRLREKEAAAMSSNMEDMDDPTAPELMLPMDLAVHMGICHIYLGEFTEGRGCFSVLMRQNPGEEPYGSMLIEAARPFIAQEKFDDAIIFLDRVAASDSYHKVKALRLVAECWVDKGNIPKAMEMYTSALDIEPYDCATLISLSRNAVRLELEECTLIAYQHLKPMAERIVLQFAPDSKWSHGKRGDVREEGGDRPDATGILAEEGSWMTLELLIEWGKLTLARNDKDINELIYTHLPVVETFVQQVANSGRAPSYLQNPTLAEYDCFLKREAQSPWHESLNETAQYLAAKLDIASDVSPETMQDILRTLITVLVLSDRIADARSVLEAASRYRAVMSLATRRELQNIVDGGGILHEEVSSTSSALVGGLTPACISPSTSRPRSRGRVLARGAAAERRDVFQDAFNDLDRDPDNLEYWFRAVATLGHISTTKRRRVIKLVEAHSEKAAAHLLQGNDAMGRGSYKFAYCSYSKAVSLSPRDPLCVLALGASLAMLIDSNKAVEDSLECAFKAVLAVQACTNILAEECKEMKVVTPPEGLYNMARIYHQIRILHLAEHLYRKALEYTNEDGSPLLPEAAFNLMALYREVKTSASFVHLCN